MVHGGLITQLDLSHIDDYSLFEELHLFDYSSIKGIVDKRLLVIRILDGLLIDRNQLY